MSPGEQFQQNSRALQHVQHDPGPGGGPGPGHEGEDDGGADAGDVGGAASLSATTLSTALPTTAAATTTTTAHRYVFPKIGFHWPSVGGRAGYDGGWGRPPLH